MSGGRYFLETLGCPKNQVDSHKLGGLLMADGYEATEDISEADLVIVNTCAFIDSAREESIEVTLSLSQQRRKGATLVMTGCLAERAGDELRAALPEVDIVAGFGESLLPKTPVTLSKKVPSFDLLRLPRPASQTPWAYVKIAEGCDRHCGFCAIPSFRGTQVSRSIDDVVGEVRGLVEANDGPAVREVVLIAQDLPSYGRDRHGDAVDPHASEKTPLIQLMDELTPLVDRVRLLYLYPSGLTPALIEKIAQSGVPYYDLSLQHVSRSLLRRMRRVGDVDRFAERIEKIRSEVKDATFRSSFIIGYPGETEEDHDQLLAFLEAATLDWAGFFPFSKEAGTYAATLENEVPHELMMERLRECTEIQDAITASRRDALIGETLSVLVDAPGVARSVHEAPEIDGIIEVPQSFGVGEIVTVVITSSLGTDLVGGELGRRVP